MANTTAKPIKAIILALLINQFLSLSKIHDSIGASLVDLLAVANEYTVNHLHFRCLKRRAVFLNFTIIRQQRGVSQKERVVECVCVIAIQNVIALVEF